MSDEGFREIQLNGKQLIFTFMAVAVVLVVTFLLGVLMGRGVRDGAVTAPVASNEIAPDPGLTPAADTNAPPSSAASDPSQGQAPAAPPAEELSYAERLLREAPPEEKLKDSAQPEPAATPAPVVKEPVAERPTASGAAAPSAKPTPPPAPAPKVPPPVASAPEPPITQPRSVPAPASAAQATDPAGPGFAVQVAAYPDRRDAEILVRQLIGKGYPAFVMDPVQGAPTKLFRVRVGKYPNRTVAEGVQARLVKTEQFTNAWIAR